MAGGWYYEQNDRQIGPVSDAALREFLRAGGLPAGTRVWTDGMPEWKPAEKLPLFANDAIASDANQAASMLPTSSTPNTLAYSGTDREPVRLTQRAAALFHQAGGWSRICAILLLLLGALFIVSLVLMAVSIRYGRMSFIDSAALLFVVSMSVVLLSSAYFLARSSVFARRLQTLPREDILELTLLNLLRFWRLITLAAFVVVAFYALFFLSAWRF